MWYNQISQTSNKCLPWLSHQRRTLTTVNIYTDQLCDTSFYISSGQRTLRELKLYFVQNVNTFKLNLRITHANRAFGAQYMNQC